MADGSGPMHRAAAKHPPKLASIAMVLGLPVAPRKIPVVTISAIPFRLKVAPPPPAVLSPPVAFSVVILARAGTLGPFARPRDLPSGYNTCFARSMLVANCATCLAAAQPPGDLCTELPKPLEAVIPDWKPRATHFFTSRLLMLFIRRRGMQLEGEAVRLGRSASSTMAAAAAASSTCYAALPPREPRRRKVTPRQIVTASKRRMASLSGNGLQEIMRPSAPCRVCPPATAGAIREPRPRHPGRTVLALVAKGRQSSAVTLAASSTGSPWGDHQETAAATGRPAARQVARQGPHPSLHHWPSGHGEQARLVRREKPRRSQLKGRTFCLGREALATSARRSIATTRQMKT